MKEQQILFEEAPNKRTVRINANTKNFKELAKMFRKNSRHLDFAKIEIAEGIAKLGLSYLKSVTPGKILKAKGVNRIERNNDTFRIIQDHPQAKFAEYGTGTLGEGGPQNPDKPSNWQYNSGPKVIEIAGNKGWFVPDGAIKVADPYYGDVKLSKGSFLIGQQAVRQMYLTRKHIKQNRTALAKRVIKKILKKG